MLFAPQVRLTERIAVEHVGLAVDDDGAVRGDVEVGRQHQRVGERGLVQRPRQVQVRLRGRVPRQVPRRLMALAAHVPARRRRRQLGVGDAHAKRRRLLAQLGDGDLLVDAERALGPLAIEAGEPQLRVGLAVALGRRLQRVANPETGA